MATMQAVPGLLIKGGEVVDGSGVPAVRADVRTAGGVITEVGADLEPQGETVLDATGAYVTPGFIDTHTHFDPTVFWDGTCDPMALHGVTTVLFGNCSLSLAPVEPEARRVLTETFCYIEDLPEVTFDIGIPWSWRTYPEYLASVARLPLGLNVAGLVGHTPIRIFVMGEAAWERPATDAEIAEMVSVLEDSLRAGAVGMSTSMGFDEHPRRGPVPSRLADDRELGALIECLARTGRLLQFIPAQTGRRAMMADVDRIAALSGPSGLTSTWIGIFHSQDRPDSARELLDFAAAHQQRGVRTYPQVSPRTLDIHVNWSGGMSFAALADGWNRFVQADRAEKQRIIGDEAWRATAREEWDRVPRAMIPHHHPERIRLLDSGSAEGAEFVGRTLADLVAARGGHPSDVLADWVAANGLAPSIVAVGVANADPDGVAATLVHPAAVIANSDAGAHLGMMCAAGDTTLLLSRHVRDRGDLSLESAVYQLTRRQAELVGMADRGLVAPGYAADLVVFDLEELQWGTDSFVSDLPGGGRRLRRAGGGYRATVVGGEVVQEGGVDTGRRPGRVVSPAGEGLVRSGG
jgi:N-acyl-D-amino-acid deacylase